MSKVAWCARFPNGSPMFPIRCFFVYWLAMLLQALSMLSNSSSVCEARKDATQRRKTCRLWNVFYWQVNHIQESLSESTYFWSTCIQKLWLVAFPCWRVRQEHCLNQRHGPSVRVFECFGQFWKPFQLHSAILVQFFAFAAWWLQVWKQGDCMEIFFNLQEWSQTSEREGQGIETSFTVVQTFRGVFECFVASNSAKIGGAKRMSLVFRHQGAQRAHGSASATGRDIELQMADIPNETDLSFLGAEGGLFFSHHQHLRSFALQQLSRHLDNFFFLRGVHI